MRDSADSYDPAFGRIRRARNARNKRHRKFYQPHDDEATYVKRAWKLQRLPGADADDAIDGLPEGDRWSTWDQVTPLARGPKPYPKWLVTDLAAVDHELGVLKTGKEADVFLVRRGVPGTDRSCLLAAKRYRDATHRQFHRDAGYLEGRRTRDSRENRAAANRTAFGRQAIAGQWANAEFAALRQLYSAGVPVPYPVQIMGTEVLLEFIGDADGTGAPRLAETRPGSAELASLWSQLVEAVATLASVGFAHGDLSPYNLLVHHGRLVIIDLPQVVDVVSHPNGRGFLDRDAKNVATWFARAGHPDADPEALAHLLAKEARLTLADDCENRGPSRAGRQSRGSGRADRLSARLAARSPRNSVYGQQEMNSRTPARRTRFLEEVARLLSVHGCLGGIPMPKSRKRWAAKAKAVSRGRLGTREGGSPLVTVPRTTYGKVRPAPPPGRQWPKFNGSPWLTWMAFSALREATPEEMAELGMPSARVRPEGLIPDMQLALVEIAPWRIAPAWADAPLSDRRTEWTSLAAEATLSGNTVAGLVEELADLEERGLIKWDQEPQTALLAANLDEALKHAGRGEG